MNSTAYRRKITVSADGRGLASHASGLLLTHTLRITGLDKDLSQRLERWHPSRAVHDPAKIITDLPSLDARRRLHGRHRPAALQARTVRPPSP
ncbi:hypothetical protein GCM10020001_039010 [Nonomuraea salmonea]